MKKPKALLEKENLDSQMRQDAEDKLAMAKGSSLQMKEKTPEELIHELRVHQIELEMQNEELRKTYLVLEDLTDRYIDLYDFAPVGYFTFSHEGIIKDVNLTGAALLGIPRQKLINRGFGHFVAPDDLEQWDRHIMSVIQNEKKRTCELWIKLEDGSNIYVRLGSVLMETKDGKSVVRTAMSDITERKWAIEALQESEEHYRTIIENSNDMIWILDTEGRFLFFNKRSEEVSGYKLEDWQGKSFAPLIYEEDLPEVGEVFQKTLSGQPQQYEVSVIRKDGSKLILSVNTTPIYSKLKVTGTVSFGRDITEQKEAEEKIKKSLEEKDILLREIHHRVKNNIQVISSMLNMQSEYVTEKKYRDMFEECQNRISSMALIHEKLYQSRDFTRIDLNEYIKDLVNDLFRYYGINTDNITLNINVENVYLGIDSGIPCGLIINELVTNSLKHAFPEGRKGEIKISLRSIGEDMIELVISDNGTGIPKDLDFENTQSLGLFLVKILVENQLQGEIHLDRSKGTEFKIKFEGGK